MSILVLHTIRPIPRICQHVHWPISTIVSFDERCFTNDETRRIRTLKDMLGRVMNNHHAIIGEVVRAGSTIMVIGVSSCWTIVLPASVSLLLSLAVAEIRALTIQIYCSVQDRMRRCGYRCL